MGIKVLHTKGRPAQVILDLNLFFSMANPDRLKEAKEYKQLTKLYLDQANDSLNEDPSNYSSFADWMKALYKIDKKNPKEFSTKYGMTILEFRKQIWDLEKNKSELIPFQDFKRKWKKVKTAK